MIKKTLCILLLIATVAAVTFAALNSSKSHSLLMQHIEQTDKKDIEPSETINPCDSIPCDSLQVTI